VLDDRSALIIIYKSEATGRLEVLRNLM